MLTPRAAICDRQVKLLVLGLCLLLVRTAGAQGLTGALAGTVRDAQGAVLPNAVARIVSPALIGGSAQLSTDARGQLRFPSLPPGAYVLDVHLQGFTPYHEEHIRIGAGATVERAVVLKLAGLSQAVVVEGVDSSVDAREPGFGTRFTVEDIERIPTRRTSMFDFLRAAPGISPTSPSSGTVTTMSAFGSATNENQFLIDGTNFTCPCSGVARAEPGVDFIQEIHIQSVGASAEFGNLEGAVVNVITRSGGERFLTDASYYGQPRGLTSQPLKSPMPAPATIATGYERVTYRDLTSSLGGPALRKRVWFFAGYQYLRDYDSQPGADAALPREYEQDKVMAKLTWKLSSSMQLTHSIHREVWANPDRPTASTPFQATNATHGSIPAVTFVDLTHTLSANTVWEARAGRFLFSQQSPPATGNLSTPSVFDRVTGIISGGPPSFGRLTIARTTGKATVSRYQPELLGASHEWKMGIQIERGEHHMTTVIPGGTRFETSDGLPLQAITSNPSKAGGRVDTAAAFASDSLRIGDRITIDAGLRFDYSRAISQDLAAVDSRGNDTDVVIPGLGEVYAWKTVSPRLGATVRASADGRTVVRGSYGRFNAGVLTGEFAAFHPAVTPITTTAYDPATGGYTRLPSVVDPRVNLQLDTGMRAPHTDESSAGLDREIGSGLTVAMAFVHKRGSAFIGWRDIGGQYREEFRLLADGRTIPVLVLTNGTAARRFLLTNPDAYSMTYNGVVLATEKRSRAWHASGSYTFSKTSGLLTSSGTSAAGAQVSTVAPPQPSTFGRDPNDLTNATGRLANDRPHMLRGTVAVSLPRIGVDVAANLQYFSGKPWASTTQLTLPQGVVRILLEPRGARRLPSQSLLDLRISKTFTIGGLGRIELLGDVLNALNVTAAEAIATDNLFSSAFAQPTVFVDPRRAMLGVRLGLGH